MIDNKEEKGRIRIDNKGGKRRLTGWIIEELKEVLGDWYRYDETPFLQAFYKAILDE